MKLRREVVQLLVVSLLALAPALPAAAQLPEGWVGKDIGAVAVPGTASVDAAGKWVVRGAGDIPNEGPDDSFYFVYRQVRGDGSIIARLLRQVHESGTAPKTGIMIRASDAPGAPYAGLIMTTSTLAWQFRDAADQDSVRQSGAASRTFPTLMRVQRSGNDVAGFVSSDGKIWRSATITRRIPMGETALFGLAVSARADDLTTAEFDTVSVQPGMVSPSGLAACGADKAVLLTWSPLAGAVGYNVYRGAAGATADQLTKVTAQPVTNASFTDSSADLVNGTTYTYALAAVFKGADGQLAEGPLVGAAGTPVAAPPGFTGCSINEGRLSGSVAYDPATGEITIRGSGGDIWDAADRFYFVSQPVEGDVQITVKALTKPSRTHDWAKAGLMIRETLEPGSRTAYLVLTPVNGLAFQWREATNQNASWPGSAAIDSASLVPPITIRLTRRGNEITPEYSLDDGKTFQSAGDPFVFEPDLARMVHVGLCITAHDANRISEAKFSGLVVKKL